MRQIPLIRTMANGDTSPMIRLCADDGMILTDGELYAEVIDVDSSDGWAELAIDSALEYLT